MDEHERRVAHALSLLDLGRNEAAEQSLRLALTGEPDSAYLTHMLAQAVWMQDRVDDALLYARNAVQLDPDEADHHTLLASILLDAGRAKDAHDAAVGAVRLAPDDWVPHHVLAGALLDIGDEGARQAAERVAHHAVTLGPNQAETHTIYGVAVWRRNDVATAERAFRNALAIDPGYSAALRNLAQLQIGDPDQQADGMDALARALVAHPQDRDLQDDLSFAIGGVVVTASLGFALATITFGGFMLLFDALLRQRAFYGLFCMVMAGVYTFRNLRTMPGGGWTRLLPWHGRHGDLLRRWLAWALGIVASLVWFTPEPLATPSWVLVSGGFSAFVLLLVTMVARAPRPLDTPDSR